MEEKPLTEGKVRHQSKPVKSNLKPTQPPPAPTPKTEDEIYAQIKERIQGDFVPLFLEDGKPAGAGYNKTSKLIYKDINDMVTVPNYHTKEETSDIRDARRRRWDGESARKEKEQFDKAEKKKFSEWPGEQTNYGENFYPEIEYFFDEMVEIHGYQYDKWPKYVWATKPKAYITKKNAYDDVYQSDLEDTNCDVELDVDGEKDLQIALDAFVDANKKNVLYWPDYSLALLINDEIEEYKKRYED